jgi:hypothetical protein
MGDFLMAYLGFVPPGVVLPFAGATAPQGWLVCDGNPVSRTIYAALFAALGTSHGQGDNVTTFNVPDYRGRIMRGSDGMFGGVNAGRDPDRAGRTAMNAGGNTGATAQYVGSVQGEATKANGLALTANAAPNAHSHGSSSMTAGVGFSQYGGQSYNHMQKRSTYATYDRSVIVTSAAVVDPDNSPGTVATAAIFGNTDNNSGSAVTLGSGNSETRPINAYVNYIIKI